MNDNVSLRSMTRGELDVLFDWAAKEGWNPGLGDAQAGWNADPKAFVAMERNGELIGGGSVMTLHPSYGFMGLFIMRKDCRGSGLGRRLWFHRRDLLLSRLGHQPCIGMDGVFDMLPFYEKGGFKLAHRSLRYIGLAQGNRNSRCINLQDIPWKTISEYDRSHYIAPRDALLRAWIEQPGAIGCGLLHEGELVAWAMARPALSGYKFGPVYADRTSNAAIVLGHVCSQLNGAQVSIDIPEPNQDAVQLVQSEILAKSSCSFGCGRMYYGAEPAYDITKLYGLLSFEYA